jgi:hypothetical protein
MREVLLELAVCAAVGTLLDLFFKPSKRKGKK